MKAINFSSVRQRDYSHASPPPPATNSTSVLVAFVPFALILLGAIGWGLYDLVLWIFGR